MTSRDELRPVSREAPKNVPKWTNSSTGLIRTPAGVFAVMHPHRLTGYKHPNSETNSRFLGSQTAYKDFYENSVHLREMTTKATGGYQKKLFPYHPNAICNRLPVKFSSEPIPAVRFCAPRNAHSHELGSKPYEKQHMTHNAAFYPKWDSLPLGFENQGIMSDFARRIHVNQNR